MRKGQKMTEEQKGKISKAHLGMKKPWSGKYMTPEHRDAISKRMIGNTLCLGRELSIDLKEKIRQSNLGKKHNISEEGMRRMKIKNYPVWNKGKDTRNILECLECGRKFKTHFDAKYCSLKCYKPNQTGEFNYRWIKDRSKVKLDNERGGPLHKAWSKDIKTRDGWRCKLVSLECFGKLQAHHILNWSKHPDLRYKLDNGITLCRFHHPTRRIDEVKLIPLFKKLIAN